MLKDMSMLPFLNKQKIPKLRKMSGVSKYGFSEDDDLVEDALNEVIQALESKNHSQLVEAIKALVMCIRNKNAIDPQQDSESI
jgi:hypothetical protein